MPDVASFRRASLDLSDLQRHALVRVARDHHPALIGAVDDPVLRDTVAALLAGGAPLVVRQQPGDRRSCGDMPQTIAVGLPLPALGKQRLGFTPLPMHAVVDIAPPPRLTDTLPHLPPVFRAPLSELAAAARATGIQYRVFGSVAWEALTGLPYLTPRSDVDLLWWPVDAAQIVQGIALLIAWEQQYGMRADGEIVLGNGAAVAWREWDRVVRTIDGARRVLVKTLFGPRLCALSELEAPLARGLFAEEGTHPECEYRSAQHEGNPVSLQHEGHQQ